MPDARPEYCKCEEDGSEDGAKGRLRTKVRWGWLGKDENEWRQR